MDEVNRLIALYGFRLRAEKCKFHMKNVRYLVPLFDKNVRKTDTKNIEVIKTMPPSTDLSTLRSFPRMVSHRGVFLPELRVPAELFTNGE